MPADPIKIGFVCKGNTCRSVMAHYFLECWLKKEGIDGVAVWSAGVAATPGRSGAAHAGTVLQEEGVLGSFSGHASRQIGKEDVEGSTYVILLTESQKQCLAEAYPEHKHVMSTLLSDLSTKPDASVDDPIGQDLETYRATFAQMRPSLEHIARKLQEEAIQT
ncbi:Protein-arginine-phosphatase [Diplonema papillatum]|nr:Protein-arginine-phosphatase [Diplonema papillatum]KAJ9457069.1 Protein-arginine-phosphatase [Diplonema papillatum]